MCVHNDLVAAPTREKNNRNDAKIQEKMESLEVVSRQTLHRDLCIPKSHDQSVKKFIIVFLCSIFSPIFFPVEYIFPRCISHIVPEYKSEHSTLVKYSVSIP